MKMTEAPIDRDEEKAAPRIGPVTLARLYYLYYL